MMWIKYRERWAWGQSSWKYEALPESYRSMNDEDLESEIMDLLPRHTATWSDKWRGI